MKRVTILAAAFALFSLAGINAFAQSDAKKEKREIRKEVNVKVENDEMVLSITTTENGETTVEEYRGAEAKQKLAEMENNRPEGAVIEKKFIHRDTGENEGEDAGKKKVIIMELKEEVSEDGDDVHKNLSEADMQRLHKHMEHVEDITMEIDDETGEVTMEFNGQKHVIKPDENGKHEMKKMMFISDDGETREVSPEEMQEWHTKHGLPEMNEEMDVQVDKKAGEIRITRNGKEEVIKLDEEDMKDGKMMFITEDSDVHTITDQDGKQETMMVMVIAASATLLDDEKGLEQDLDVENFQLYPNPNGGKFNIMFDLDSKRKTIVQATDMNGRVLFNDEVKKFNGHYTNEIDLSEQPKGTYLINVIQGRKKTAKRVSVQ